MKTRKVKAAGRYGARYGRSVRNKITEIESVQRKKQHCIFCKGVAKRVSKGIWECNKCDKRFASHVFHLNKSEGHKQ